MTYSRNRFSGDGVPGSNGEPTAWETSVGWTALDCVHLVTPATRLATPKGEVAAQKLVPGDSLVTRVNGTLTILGILPVTVPRETLIGQPRLTPVSIAAGALGQDVPPRPLVVPPSARIVGMPDHANGAAVAVTDLIGHADVSRVFPNSVSYLRIILSVPADVLADGVWLAPDNFDAHVPEDATMSWPIATWQRLASVTNAILSQETQRRLA
jgi:Hint domain